MLRHYLVCLSLLSACAGCEIQSEIPVAIAESIPSEPSKSDFGFAGKWVRMQQPPFNDLSTGEHLTVKQKDDGTYEVADGERVQATFKAIPLDEDNSYALLEIRLVDKAISERTYLAIATCENQQLYYWLIAKPQKLADLICKSGSSAIVEQHTFSSTIRADGMDVLQCIKKHSRDLVGRHSTLVQAKD